MSDLAKFKDTVLEVIETPKGKAFSSMDIGNALGYKNPQKRISEIFKRHEDEFLQGSHWDWFDQASPQIADSKRNSSTTRVYYLRGVSLLAMFATTSNAKAFRRWAADILSQVQQGNINYQPPAQVPNNLRDRVLAELAQRDLSTVPTNQLLVLLDKTLEV